MEPPARAPRARERASVARRSLPAATASAGEPRPPTSEGLIEEVRQLDRARGDLDAARFSLALAVLDDYDRRFPRGQLALEAAVLRASTLEKMGHREAARALARRLSTQPGNARYRAELERLTR